MAGIAFLTAASEAARRAAGSGCAARAKGAPAPPLGGDGLQAREEGAGGGEARGWRGRKGLW